MTYCNGKKVLLFYNPYSGSGLFRTHLDTVISKYQKAGLLTIPVRSASYLNISNVLSRLESSEYDHLAVAGGDGTINLLVNAIIKNNIDLPVAIYPTGTANDFAHHLNLPTEVGKMAEMAVEHHISTVDVGKANDRYFLNVASLGALMDVSRKTDPNLKNTLGVVSYYLWALPELSHMKSVDVTLTVEDTVYEEKMFFMVVMNGRAAGGFKNVAPDAEINDGLLDVLLFKPMPWYKMIPLFVSVIRGKQPKDKNIVRFQEPTVRIDSEENITVAIDGEKDIALPVELSVVRNRLKVLTQPMEL